MKVLWLASWYPNKLSPFNGDFIRRHAEAASRYDEITVIHVVKDEEGDYTRDIASSKIKKGNLTEWIIYYHVANKFPFLGRILSAKKYRELFRNAIETYIAENGEPDLVHVQVGMKAGALALWLQKDRNIPYVVTEHWTGFLQEATERFEHLPSYIQNMWQQVAKGARSVSFVSRHLENAFLQKLSCQHPVVIPNVVNTEIFAPSLAIPEAYPSFIHVSGLDERKNPRDMLAAFRLVLNEFPGARLQVFGSSRKEVADLVNKWGLSKNVHLHEEVPQEVLAIHTLQSTAALLYSNCETFGCVIIEANACGIPVIVSDIPVFHETVKEGMNGFFVKPNQPQELALRMIEMIRNRTRFNANDIINATHSKYSYPVVGKMISDWYRQVLQAP